MSACQQRLNRGVHRKSSQYNFRESESKPTRAALPDQNREFLGGTNKPNQTDEHHERENREASGIEIPSLQNVGQNN